MAGVVQIQNVSKLIKGKTIIDSLSFEVNSGKYLGFWVQTVQVRRPRSG